MRLDMGILTECNICMANMQQNREKRDRIAREKIKRQSFYIVREKFS